MFEDELNSLNEKTGAINESIRRLETSTHALATVQAGQIAKVRRLNRWMMAVIAVHLVLIIAGLYQIMGIQRNSERISAIQEQGSRRGQQTASEQEARRKLVFCPLWEVLLRQYDPRSPQALADPAEYERWFKVIEQGAAHLGCDKRTRGR